MEVERPLFTSAILLAFLAVAPVRTASPSGQAPACRLPVADDRSPAAVFDEEEQQGPAPTEVHDPSDDPHPWQPHDQSYSPFDDDGDDDEMQA